MRKICGIVGMLCVLTLAPSGAARAQTGTIKVNFTNNTSETVTFFLNGGKGLETRLKAGESSDCTVAVDQGVQPIVKIYQPSGGGEPRKFAVANGGRYSFKYKNAGIENFFAE